MTLRHARGEAGFTLVELLVAAGMSIVLLIALTTMLLTTVDQTQRTGAQVAATGQARTALAIIENELHSACIGGGTAPVQAGSTGTDLDFLTYSGSSDAVGSSSSNLPVWHDLSFANGNLVDKQYTTTAIGAGYAQGSLVSSTQLLSHVSLLSPPSGNPSAASPPLFQYFRYQSFLNSSDGNYYWAIPDGTNANPVTGSALTASPLQTPLSTSDAGNTVEVVISMSVGSPLRSTVSTGVADNVTDTVSLRLTTPPNYSTAANSGDYGPCQ